MIKQKIFYYNDSNKPKSISVKTLDNRGIVEARSWVVIEIDMRDGAVPFIKEWDNDIVFISDVFLDDIRNYGVLSYEHKSVDETK